MSLPPPPARLLLARQLEMADARPPDSCAGTTSGLIISASCKASLAAPCRESRRQPRMAAVRSGALRCDPSGRGWLHARCSTKEPGRLGARQVVVVLQSEGVAARAAADGGVAAW
ncbi:hypothetical protein BDA96_10G135300 [Sorghum bicolor]|uniref:Uncharacterized protein n=2 Tax=Sorghum bicolor TaxID=4558 RepID=A0A1W0VSE5_SORBI|nr:hypothetical protein BDA96_10G135300 [Sorghum bicolor]OQU76208.1 hypothetical protein SORBI_3010G110901 [Sorghum bicolor]OQU76209.1 hypothetical protein SORBI_3010G110901 [Sorghum bicolor]